MKRRFRMYKFRTMVADAERLQASLEDRNEATGPAFKIRNDPRITPIGRFLRRTSIDELPQLWNVLRGDMSLVGPRPMATRDVGLFEEPWLMRRFSVRPGSRVCGRSAAEVTSASIAGSRWIWSTSSDGRCGLMRRYWSGRFPSCFEEREQHSALMRVLRTSKGDTGGLRIGFC